MISGPRVDTKRACWPGGSPWRVSTTWGHVTLSRLRQRRKRLRLRIGGASMLGEESMEMFDRITRDPAVMGGKPCIRGMRVTVGTILGLLSAGTSEQEILAAYPYLEAEDLRQALGYAAWRLEELEVAVGQR